MLDEITNIMLGPLVIIITAILFVFLILFFVFFQMRLFMTLKNNIDTLLTPLDVDGLNKELEPFGFAYEEEGDLFYSIMNPWQRKYGYCKAYDDSAPLFCMIIDSEPIYFNYDNRSWLIEFWKGQYGMTTGAEVGIYVAKDKPNLKPEALFYESITDEERLPIFCTLKKLSKPLTIRKARHWWLTSFKLGEFSKPKNLVCEIKIILKNEAMTNAFLKGLEKTGYKNIEVFYNTVYITFDKPYTKQSKFRHMVITYLVQRYNKQNCWLYQKLTKDYDTALDKINFIRAKFPILYNELFNFQNTKQLFETYRTTVKNSND